MIVCGFWELDPFHLCCWIFLFRVVHYYLCNVLAICSDITPFIHDICNLCLFFSLLVLIEVYQFCWSFQRSSFAFIDFLWCFPILNFIESALIFIISFPIHALFLFHSTSGFLKWRLRFFMWDVSFYNTSISCKKIQVFDAINFPYKHCFATSTKIF